MTDRRRALIVRGGWSGHSPVETSELFVPFLEATGFQIEIRDDAEAYADAQLMAGVDLVVQANSMAEASTEAVDGLRSTVAAGTGLAGWHGGIVDSYRNHPEYLQLVGGQFTHHPARPAHEHTGGAADFFMPFEVTIVDGLQTHPIVGGIDRFTLDSEQYWVLSDDYNDVLATTTIPARPHDPWSRAVTCPAVWTRTWGAGRVFVTTVGHRPDELEHPDVRRIVERGMVWAARDTATPREAAR